MGDAADDAYNSFLWQEFNRDESTRSPNWHRQHDDKEPRCSVKQWRTMNRKVVLNMYDMAVRHLDNCIRFASTKPQHSSKLSALLAERARRPA